MSSQPSVTPEQLDAHRVHLDWLDDCRRWRSDHRRAIALLAKVQAAILEQEAALESHTVEIQSHEMYLQRYKLSAFAPDTADEAFLEAEHA
jgi:hypothetical protein